MALNNIIYIGDDCFNSEAFNKIAETYDETVAKVQKGKVSDHHFEDILDSIPGFKETRGTQKLTPYLMDLIVELYKACNESLEKAESIRQKISKEWINQGQSINASNPLNNPGKKLVWVDLFSALNKYYGVFSGDTEVVSEMPTAFYDTKMSRLAFALGWENDVFLYIRNPFHLVLFCAIIKGKTKDWANNFYNTKIKPMFKNQNHTQNMSGTITVMRDVCSILNNNQMDGWENKIEEYMKENVNSFDGGINLFDQNKEEKDTYTSNDLTKKDEVCEYQVYSESVRVEENLKDYLSNLVKSQNKEFRIFNFDEEINTNSNLYKRLFHCATSDLRNRQNLLVVGDDEQFFEDISYLRKMVLIAMVDDYIENERVENAQEAMDEINEEMVQIGIRPIYNYGDGVIHDVFDWYCAERLKLEE